MSWGSISSDWPMPYQLWQTATAARARRIPETPSRRQAAPMSKRHAWMGGAACRRCLARRIGQTKAMSPATKSQEENRSAEKRTEAGIQPHIFRVSRQGSASAHGRGSLVASSSENFNNGIAKQRGGMASAAMKISHWTCSEFGARAQLASAAPVAGLNGIQRLGRGQA